MGTSWPPDLQKAGVVTAANISKANPNICRRRQNHKQVRKVLWTRKGVRATVVTSGHCTHAELTNGHALASCYSCCVYSQVYANSLSNYLLMRK